MKVFSKEKFIEAKKKEGRLSNDEIKFALKTWVRRIDGQKVVDGQIGSFLVEDGWCIEIKEKEECER